jgi:phosphoribosylformylglycinamidine cyclo-ligase
MLNGQKTVKRGDAVIGIASSGLHTNGYSLARKIFFEQMKLKPSSRVTGLKGTIGQELLKEHISYGPLVQKLLKQFNRRGELCESQTSKSKKLGARGTRPSENMVKAFAHITGGGFVDNIPRVLPKTCDVVIRKGSWNMPPIFQIIEAKGGVPDAELYQVFNMGIGMVAIVSAAKAEAVLKFIRAQRHDAWLIGEVTNGTGAAKMMI